jgi:hypothetical protein
MDITPQDNTTQQSVSDDQELAKALAGVMPDEAEVPTVPTAPAAEPETSAEPVAAAAAPAQVPEPAPQPAPEPAASPAQPTSELDAIKNSALEELRPIIDKVDLPPEEKFDTYLMLLRSTDDKALVGPAHTIAQSITDEKRRAEALLEIIKEIDYLSRDTQQTQQ